MDLALPEGIRAHLPVLLVIVPLFGGLLSPFIGLIPVGRSLMAWLWALLVSGVVLVCALALMLDVQTSGAIIYRIGSWPEDYGIAYVVDSLNAYVILVIALLGFLSTIYAKHSVAAEISKDRHHLFYAVWLLVICGMVGICVTGDTFNVYVLLEIASLTAYTLIALGGDRDRRALVAALKYLILGSIGATFILISIGYLLMMTGTLNMIDMHEQLMRLRNAGELVDNRTLFVSFAFLMVGLGLKMALFPLHTWLPNAYTYAPSAVSVLMAATMTKVAVYMFFRFVFTIYGDAYDSSVDMYFLALLAGVGIVVSSITAIRQTDVKTLLAYSSVGQIAYIVLGFSLANQAGVTSSIIHIFNHAIVKGAMFMAVGAVALRVGGTLPELKTAPSTIKVSDFKGLGRKMPLTMAAFTIGGASLIGVPLTAGFISKWYLVQGTIDAGYWGMAFVVLLGGVLALVYVWRLVEIIWLAQPDRSDHDEPVREAPLSMLLPMWILIGASVWFGIDATWTANAASAAAHMLLDGGP
jgi:multicomponent Na+:H+ antiporter subunit D